MSTSIRKRIITFLISFLLVCVGAAAYVGVNNVSAAAVNGFEWTTGASIRVDTSVENYASSGIRFRAYLTDDVYNKVVSNGSIKADAELGMTIVPKAIIDNFKGQSKYTDFFAYVTSLGVKKSDISVAFSAEKIIKSTDPNTLPYYVNGALVSIKEANMAREYQALAYYTTNGGSSYVYSDVSDYRTVGQVAAAAYGNEPVTYNETLIHFVEKSYDVTVDTDLNGLGIKDYPYVISNATEYATFVNKVANGSTYENSYVRLDTNLSGVTEHDANTFNGTFDYNGHTINNAAAVLPEITSGDFQTSNGTTFTAITGGIKSMSANNMAYHKTGTFEYGSLTAEFTLNGASGDNGFIFALNRNGATSFWESGVSYYFAFIDSGGNARLGKVNNGWTNCGTAAIAGYSATGTYVMEIIRDTGIITVNVNGVTYIRYTDVSPLTGTQYGVRSGIAGISYTGFLVKDRAPTPDNTTWTASGVTANNGVYTFASSTYTVSTSDVEDKNTLIATFNYTGNSASNYEYTAIRAYSGSSYYQFGVWPNTASNGPAVMLIQYNTDDPVSRIARIELSLTKGTDYTMLVTVSENFFAVYIDNVLITSSFALSHKISGFEVTEMSIVAKGCPATVKNLMMTYFEPTMEGYLDFTFSSAPAVKSFKSTNANLTYSDEGNLVATIIGSNPVITSPTINVAAGTEYSAKLCVRNTLVVRLKNNSSATQLKVSYITKDNATYDGRNKTFTITPNSDYVTYYFNMSDVNPCTAWTSRDNIKTCTDYLTEFKLQLIGASSGSIEIDEIHFSREDKIVNYAATSLSCTANPSNNTVTVSGTLQSAYANQKVTIIKTYVTNYNQLLTYSDSYGSNSVVASATASGTSFSVTFPLANGSMTHLSSLFLATVGSASTNYTTHTKLGEAFMIENWRDFSDNPYEFSLNSLTVDVTSAQFGAKGDAFTNDTQAIQSAIDYVSANGGGKVVIPGDTSTAYGRRYSITGLKLKDNVELYISTGAVLWQSHNEADYDYQLYFGHENMGDANVPWGLSALMHEPFIWVNGVDKVRITGGGTLRMDDTGTEWLDGNGYAWDSNILSDCSQTAHLVPIVIYGSTNVEVSDITIMRNNNWHAYIRESSNVYFGNVHMTEVNCINGDGLDFSTAVHDVVVDRCSLYSNDDALVLAVTINDPRDDASIWRKKTTVTDKSVYNFKIRHSQLFGGHGLTLIPWASDSTNEQNVEIYNIDVQDCVLGGSSTGVGGWADNPFYGTSSAWLNSYGSTDAAEDGDYSTMHDIFIYNNEYIMSNYLYGMPITNFVTDAKDSSGNTLVGATDLVNSNFDKKARYGTGIYGTGYADEKTWISGLANWTREGNVGVEKIGTKTSTYINSSSTFTQDNYAAYIQGEGSISQGLWRTIGYNKFTLDVKFTSGTATLFAKDSKTGVMLGAQTISASSSFTTRTFIVYLSKDAVVSFGVKYSGGTSDKLYFDNASVTVTSDAADYSITGTTYSNSFSGYSDFNIYSTGSSVSAAGSLSFGNDAEYKAILDSAYTLNNFKLKVTIDVTQSKTLNAGVYLFVTDVGNASDEISAYNVQIEAAAGASDYTLTAYKFANNKYDSKVASASYVFGRSGGTATLTIVAKNGMVYVFLDSTTTPYLSFGVDSNLKGGVGLRSQRANNVFTNFSLTTTQLSMNGGTPSYTNDFSANANDFTLYSSTGSTSNVTVSGGGLNFANDAAYKAILNSEWNLSNFEVSTTINLNNSVLGAGLYLFVQSVGNGADEIKGYNVHIEKAAEASGYSLVVHQFDGSAWVGQIAKASYTFDMTSTATIRVVANNGTVNVYLDSKATPYITFTVDASLAGGVGLRSHFVPSVFDTFTVTSDQLSMK